METRLKYPIQKINIFTIVLSLIYSCSPTRTYTSATIGSTHSYVPKLEYRDKDTSAVYVSGSIGRGSHFPFFKSNGIIDTKTNFLFNIHKSFTKKHFNYYYGLGASIGIYKFANEDNSNFFTNSTRNWYTVNSLIGINFNIPTKKADWRLIGLHIDYHYEFGNYLSTLRKIKLDLPGININDKASILSYHINSEVMLKLKDNRSLGMGLLIFGDTPFYSDNLNMSSVGVFTSYKFNNTTFSLIIEGSERNENLRLGVAYQIY